MVLPPQTDFDIDPMTGFIPPEPLPRLSGQYTIWENALAEAPGVIRLGDDISEEALALKPEGESWRARTRSVGMLLVCHYSQLILTNNYSSESWIFSH